VLHVLRSVLSVPLCFAVSHLENSTMPQALLPSLTAGKGRFLLTLDAPGLANYTIPPMYLSAASKKVFGPKT